MIYRKESHLLFLLHDKKTDGHLPENRLRYLILRITEDLFAGVAEWHALMSKYGEPRSQNPEDAFILKSIIFNLASINASMGRWFGSYGVFDHYAEWIIDCSEYKVNSDGNCSRGADMDIASL